MRGVIALILLVCFLQTELAVQTGCTSPIYCQGPFLKTMQERHLTNDSKQFVDRPLKASVADVLFAFQQIPEHSSQEVYEQFMEVWMHPSGYEVQKVIPSDWVERPAFVEELPSDLQPFALSLHSKWRTLVRIFNDTGLCEGCYSSIAVPYPFVVAGGRFVEFYYWDSYWALQGLLVSNMTETAQHVVNNLLYVVDQYGFVPNGGRIYYLNRSQPPMLTLMVKMLYDALGHQDWLQMALPTLEKEYHWWMDNREVERKGKDGGMHKAQRYHADLMTPRPESYREDVLTASRLPPKERPKCFQDLASGAESGWDFSSRWLQDFNQLSSIHTSDIVPTDLNSILYVVEQNLAQLYTVVGNTTRAAYFTSLANHRANAIKNLFWNDYAQCWFDLAMVAPTSESPFYISNIMPIWAKAYHQTPQQALKIFQNLWPQMLFPGGVPTSLIMSKQQWDFPNAWAPLQQFIIDALDGLNLPEATAMADSLAVAWFNSNYCAWEATLKQGGLFFEKYDVTKPGSAGGGGEYEVQAGFGWTNGVLLKLLTTRSHLLKVPTCYKDH